MSKKKIVAISFLLLLILIAVLFFNVKVSNVTLSESFEVDSELNFDDMFIGKRLFLINTAEFESEILATGLVETITVEKVLPNSLHLNIVWKKPVIAVKSAGKYVILSNDGYVLDIKKGYLGYDVVDGIIVKSAIVGSPVVTEDDKLTIGAVNLVTIMKDNANIFVGETVYPNIKVVDGNIIHEINDRYWINFGDGDNLLNRFKSAVAIYNFNYNNGVKTGIINVSIDNHAIYEAWK